MGRWRPPRQRGSAYITVEGAERLQRELTELWKVERPVVTETVSQAAKNGDRSENGDYIYGKKRLREIDSRVRFLGKRLEELTVVDRLPDNRDKVFFGAWVSLDIISSSNPEYRDGEQLTYRIVGPDEFDVGLGYISMDSPLARALLGKNLDDEINVETPEGAVCAEIAAINYRQPADKQC